MERLLARGCLTQRHEDTKQKSRTGSRRFGGRFQTQRRKGRGVTSLCVLCVSNLLIRRIGQALGLQGWPKQIGGVVQRMRTQSLRVLYAIV